MTNDVDTALQNANQHRADAAQSRTEVDELIQHVRSTRLATGGVYTGGPIELLGEHGCELVVFPDKGNVVRVR